MSGPEKSAKPLTFQELPELRRKTEVISKLLQDQVQAHLETLRPILSPELLFGRHAGAKGDVALADRALFQLQQLYKPFSARPFDLPSQLDQYCLTLVGNPVTLYPRENHYQAGRDRESKAISLTPPLRWVMSFSSAYTLAQLRQALAGKGERRPEHVRQFVVNALVTQLIITHIPGLVPL